MIPALERWLPLDGPVRLAQPEALWLLLPSLLVGAWRLWSLRRRPHVVVAQVAPLVALPRTWAVRLAWLPAALGALGLILSTASLSRPQVRLAAARDDSVEGIDIVVALDLSTSMRALDFQPRNRFFVATEVLKGFVASRPNDRLGLVVFAAEAFTQCPLTLDHDVLQQVIDGLRLGVLDDGTAIGDGLATSLNRLRPSEARSKVVILITDGDNNSGTISPMEAARMAHDQGMRVYTILVGKGGRVPFPQAGPFGIEQTVMMEMPVNPALLEQISATTGGRSYTAVDRASLEESLRDILNALEKSRLFESGSEARYEELFHWLLWPGLLLLLADLVLRSTRLRRFP